MVRELDQDIEIRRFLESAVGNAALRILEHAGRDGPGNGSSDAFKQAEQCVFQDFKSCADLPADDRSDHSLSLIHICLSSWEWKYGRKLPFEYTVSQRFPWGGIELCFHVNGGVIQEIKVYSDAMQEQLARRLEECMKGCAYRRNALLARLKEARLDRENEEADRQIRSDIGRLILREVMK